MNRKSILTHWECLKWKRDNGGNCESTDYFSWSKLMLLCDLGCKLSTWFWQQNLGTCVWDENNKKRLTNSFARCKVVCWRPCPQTVLPDARLYIGDHVHSLRVDSCLIGFSFFFMGPFFKSSLWQRQRNLFHSDQWVNKHHIVVVNIPHDSYRWHCANNEAAC